MIVREYGPAGHLKRLVEQPTKAPKETQYLYNQLGQLETLIKADHVQLIHSYNAQGLLAELSASDSSVHYHYHYDPMGNLILVEDLLHGTEY